MSYSIIVDPHRGMAVLVADEPLYGLGPAVAADEPEEAQEVLQTFVEHLQSPPDQMPTLELMNEWQSFLMAFHGMIQVPQEVADERAQETAGGDPPAPEGETPAPEVPGPQSGADASEQDSPVTPSSSEEPAGSVSPAPETEPPAVPAADAADKQCFACGGDGAIEIDGQTFDCRTCNGTGRLPVGG